MGWLRSFFSSAPHSEDPRVIDIVEQAVAVVDPRLRALSDYQTRLLPAAQLAWEHVCTITRPMPEPVELARERWSIDPLLRAVFATPDEIDALLARSSEVKDWIAKPGSSPLQRINALLVMRRTEYKRLGVEHSGEQTMHDVQQTTVDFSEHRIVCLSDTLPHMRQLIKRSALNQLYLRALDEIQSILGSRQQLEQQRSVLQTRLRLLQGQGGTLDELLSGTVTAQAPELARKMEENAARLNENHATLDTLDDYLKVLVHTLEHAKDYLHATPLQLSLNTMNVMVDAASGNGSIIPLTDVTFERAVPLTICVAPVCFLPRFVEPAPVDLKHAERFL